MKKDETVIPNRWEVETLNETRVQFAMQSDEKSAPSIFCNESRKSKYGRKRGSSYYGRNRSPSYSRRGRSV